MTYQMPKTVLKLEDWERAVETKRRKRLLGCGVAQVWLSYWVVTGAKCNSLYFSVTENNYGLSLHLLLHKFFHLMTKLSIKLIHLMIKLSMWPTQGVLSIAMQKSHHSWGSLQLRHCYLTVSVGQESQHGLTESLAKVSQGLGQGWVLIWRLSWW